MNFPRLIYRISSRASLGYNISLTIICFGTKCFSLLIIPTFRDIVLDIASIWSFQVKFSSMRKPRNLVLFTRDNSTLSKITLILFSGLEVWWVVPIIMKFVLLAFTDNLLVLNQFVTSFNSVFIKSTLLLIYLSEHKMVVSSAKSINWSIFDVFTISLMYSLNKSGPKIEPWGTPHIISRFFFFFRLTVVIIHILSSNTKIALKPVKYDTSKVIMFPFVK